MPKVKAVCIDPGATITLEKGQTYYLELNGPNHAYVYKKPTGSGHWGCYQLKYFKQLQEQSQEQHQEPEQWPDGLYIAQVNKWRGGYRMGDEFIIGPSKHQPYFNVYLLDGRLIGSYITNFFEIVKPYEGGLERKRPQAAQEEPKQKEGTNTLPAPTKVIETKERPKKRVKIEYEQLTLF